MVFQDTKEVINFITPIKTSPKRLQDAKKEHSDLKALIDGKNFQTLLVTKIEHLESNDRIKARQKYSREIMDLFERLQRKTDNVYSANGTNKEYKIDNETIKKEVIAKLSNIRGNQSLMQWLQMNWMDVYHSDPAGLIMLEYLTENGEVKDVYPTYKEVLSIRSYHEKGQNVEWVLFEPKRIQGSMLNAKILKKDPGYIKRYSDTQQYMVVRFVDDENDYSFTYNGSVYKEIPELTFEHPFGMCPAIINSNITEKIIQTRLSPFHKIIPVTKEYARDVSIKTLFKFSQGFALFWRYVVYCSECKGKGVKDNKTCSHCDGHGIVKRKDVTDEVRLPVPKEGQQVLTTIGGFLTPPLDIWDQYTKELVEAEVKMEDTHWGSHVVQGEGETATARYIDTQPVISRLNAYGDVAEWVEWQLSEWIVNLYDPTKKKDERNVIVNYGRLYIIETPEAILDRYQKAKTDEAPITVLDKIMLDYIMSKYKNNEIGMARALLKFSIEPYPHYTVEQVNDVMGVDIAQKKLLFHEWWTSKEANIDQVKDTKETLEIEFNDFITNQNKE
jgi:hypothetical protein